MCPTMNLNKNTKFWEFLLYFIVIILKKNQYSILIRNAYHFTCWHLKISISILKVFWITFKL